MRIMSPFKANSMIQFKGRYEAVQTEPKIPYPRQSFTRLYPTQDSTEPQGAVGANLSKEDLAKQRRVTMHQAEIKRQLAKFATHPNPATLQSVLIETCHTKKRIEVRKTLSYQAIEARLSALNKMGISDDHLVTLLSPELNEDDSLKLIDRTEFNDNDALTILVTRQEAALKKLQDIKEA